MECAGALQGNLCTGLQAARTAGSVRISLCFACALATFGCWSEVVAEEPVLKGFF